MRTPKHHRAAFTLVELMIVIVLLGVLAGMAMPHFQPPLIEQLKGVASVIAADLDYARSLAVTNNSTYRVAFSNKENRYVLTHVGSNSALDVLPPSPFRPAGDAPDEQTCDLNRIPHLGATVQLYVVHESSAANKQVDDIVFGPLGGTVRAAATTVWLRCGVDDSSRYLSLTVDPITGLIELGEIQSSPPVTMSAAS